MSFRCLRVASTLIVPVFVVAAWASSTGPAFAAQNAGGAATEASSVPGTHTLNLKDADIQVLIATVSEITGKNFIVGPTVQGKVTVISAKPMRPDEIYDVFLSVLRIHGFAALPSGNMVKIVPEAAAQQDGSGGLAASSALSGDELVTQIIPVKHVAASELVGILRPLMPQGAQLIAHPGSNSLVVSDRAGNVARISSIVQRIDTVSDAQVEMIPLLHANAAEIARTLAQLADNKGADATGDAPKIFADQRTNSILLSGGKSGRLRMRALITHLDTPLSASGDTNVVYLHYANAKDLVSILQGVASTLTGEVTPGKTAAGAGAAAGAATQGAAGSSGSGAASIATIQAHEDTNSLVISAPPAVFRSLQEVIRHLDIRRPQVLIEAVIAEVTEETANELGVQWQSGSSHILGGTNFTSGNSAAAGNNIITATSGLNGTTPSITLGNGFNMGYLSSVTLPNGTKLLDLGALVTALRSNTKNNILSTPSVMTLDNQQAIVKVGQEVPFITGEYQTTSSASSSSSGTSTTSNPYTTITRKDVGLTLTVTPHINEGDSVKLEIHQEVSSLAATVSGAADLVTNKREVQTTVLVKDDAVLVIGGLISDNVDDSVQKVPGLGDVPVLGNLFRYRSNDHKKQNLMVFLHPRILRDAATEAYVSSEKYNYIRTEQLEMRDNKEIITPRANMPMLPDVHDFLASPPLDVTPPEAPQSKRR